MATIGLAKQPDIGYQPDFDKYTQRTIRLAAERRSNGSLPEGFPAELKSGLVWNRESFQGEQDWTFVLSKAQLGEVDEALEYFKSTTTPSYPHKKRIERFEADMP